jgi:hypothetical protein
VPVKDDPANLLVRGRILRYDSQRGRQPILVIDGEEISREQFGRMAMGLDSLQFRFEVRDQSENI